MMEKNEWYELVIIVPYGAPVVLDDDPDECVFSYPYGNNEHLFMAERFIVLGSELDKFRTAMKDNVRFLDLVDRYGIVHGINPYDIKEYAASQISTEEIEEYE